MKFQITFLTLCSGLIVDAFPALTIRSVEGLTPDRFKLAIEQVERYRKNRRSLTDTSKPIDVSGEHAFLAPSEKDQRGPCPGLNALANHNYISHDGITSFVEVTAAINQVFGMGIDLALILGIMGTIWTGSPLSIVPKFSIGGTVAADGSDNIFENLFGLLGNPRGLRGSHNWIESDSSLTRDDLYVTADAWSMNMTLFRDIHDRADRNGVISIGLLAEQAARRWHFSVSHNPHFYYGPVTGMVSRNAGYLFLGRLLSNHTYEHPDGVLTQEVFRKFFAVYENSEGNLAYRKGHETIPKNWYRTKREYGLVLLNADIVSWVLKHPELGSIGGNTGTVNSFAAVDLHNITGGVLNSTLLLENNNFLCFVFELLKTFLPNSLSPLFSTIEGPLNLITNVLSASMRSLECPAWKDITQGEKPLWDTIQHSFTGASEAGSSL